MGALTTSLYNLFLYDLCDVYLEEIKPIINDTTEANEGKRRCAQITLFAALEHGLRLIHPVMPFVSEELWQRLPATENKGGSMMHNGIPSIMVASYPIYGTNLNDTYDISQWDNDEIESEMDFVKEVIRCARSIKTQYLPTGRPDFFVYCIDTNICEQISKYALDIATLVKAKSVVCLDASKNESTPDGCALNILDERVTIYINLKGMINAEAELMKLKKQLDQVEKTISQTQAKVENESFIEKVKEDVKESMFLKLETAKGERTKILESIENFKKLL